MMLKLPGEEIKRSISETAVSTATTAINALLSNTSTECRRVQFRHFLIERPSCQPEAGANIFEIALLGH